MLGIPVLEKKTVTSPATLEAVKDLPKVIGGSVASGDDDSDLYDVVIIKEEKYSGLNPKAQEIIAAGKMGLPVKPCLKNQASNASSSALVSPLASHLDRIQQNHSDAQRHL